MTRDPRPLTEIEFMVIQEAELNAMDNEELLDEIHIEGSEYLWVDIRKELARRLFRASNCDKVEQPRHGKWGFGKHETAVGLHVAMCRARGLADVEIAYVLACTYKYEQLAELLPHMNAAQP